MTRRVFLLCVGLVVITAGFFLLQKLNAPTDAEVLQAEQEIYALLLAIQRNNNSDTTVDIQLVEFTNSGKFKLGLPEGGVGIFQGELELKYFPNLEKKTLLDFQNKNSASHPIMKYLPDSKNVILVNPSSGKQLFWWVSFSRIGFNPSMSQALVLVGDCRGKPCYNSINDVFMISQGTYWLLQKEDGKWAIKDAHNAWFIESPAP